MYRHWLCVECRNAPSVCECAVGAGGDGVVRCQRLWLSLVQTLAHLSIDIRKTSDIRTSGRVVGGLQAPFG